MNAELLRAAGEALFGDQWQSPLARALDVADRTMRRWVAGDSTIPDGVANDIAAIAKARGRTLGTIERKMKAVATREARA